MSTGWYLSYSYDNGNCANGAFGTVAYATGVCLKSSSSQSAYINCTASNDGTTSCTKDYYTTGDCTGTSYHVVAALGCSPAGDNMSFFYQFAGPTSDIKSLLPADGDTYAVATYYSDACNNLLAFDATVVNQCVADTAFSSIYVNYPTQMSYNTSTACIGTFKKTTYATGCSASGKTSTSFNYVSSQVIGTTTVDDDNSSNSNSDGLSSGEIAGVVIGVILIVGILIGLGYYCLVVRGQKKDALLKNQLTIGSENQRASENSVNMNWK